MDVGSENQDKKTNEERLSYKFQRLREKLRQAIVTGELAGKLPGERVLAKRFHANAKTLSKALTDLAAEGLLDRSIGRGTFVKGSNPTSSSGTRRWLLLCDSAEDQAPLVKHILERHPESQVVKNITEMRPSFINQFQGVILMSDAMPETMIRDLVVRNIPVVAAGYEPKMYSMHSVLIDRALGAACLGRDLFLAGHLRVAAIESRGQTTISETLKKTAARFAPDAIVDVATADEVGSLIADGVTGLVCDSARSASRVMDILSRLNLSVPTQASVSAVGLIDDGATPPCTGYFVSSAQKAETILQMLQDNQQRRPTTLWLTGTCSERATITPMATMANAESQSVSMARLSAVAV